ncbi:MAG: deoxyribose-phosphate aldolase [Clostridiales bacterium]|nr:deoxyribose-phosphate aldolase [Clostridiales bacterium]
MEKSEILSHVDLTLLKAFASWEDIQKLCREAAALHTASVCIPPCYVKRVRSAFPELTICTVIGFPLGYSVPEAKLMEARRAIEDGADELDMVVNISDVKNHDYPAVEEEVRLMRYACGGQILKVIIETCYLTREEKIRLCQIVSDTGADYIKTSTGFGTAGAALEDVRLFKEYLDPDVKIKAAGGIRTLKDMEAYLKEGCARIGSSMTMALND